MACMDANNRALCKLLRDEQGLSWRKIAKRVVKTDGVAPEFTAVRRVVKHWNKKRRAIGRPRGTRTTTKAEDKLIVDTMLHIRGAEEGGFVCMREVKGKLPEELRELSCETLRLRCREAGYKVSEKIQKDVPSEAIRLKRLDFAKKHIHRSARSWLKYVHAVGDLKWYGWYPDDLQPIHKRLRVKKTYMLQSEKYKPGFLRPKEWFSKENWKKVKKVKVLGFTCSTGAKWVGACPTPWDNVKYADMLKDKVVPFLKRQFPGGRTIRLLLDGEKLLRAPAPKAVMDKNKLEFLEDWPPRSPDLNPQENVWAWTERRLRAEEPTDETYEDFLPRLMKVHKDMPAPMCRKLIMSMEKRMAKVVGNDGGPINY